MKAKRHQKVIHTKSGKRGVVSSVVRGTVRVIFHDGTSGIYHGSKLSKDGWGCAFIVMVPAAFLLGGLIVVYSWTA